MKFRTEYFPAKTKFNIERNERILTLGSCFSDNIGGILKDYLFEVDVNPLGTIFNPLSIFNFITQKNLVDEDVYYCFHSSQYFNHHFHSKFHDSNLESFKVRLFETHNGFNNLLEKSDVVIITLGTSIVYQLLENQEVISNCHKQNPNLFSKTFISYELIINALDSICKSLKGKKIILTVSPVRHIKDGIENNNISKSMLILACSKMKEKHVHVDYFAAFELMNDDLRDYRFYEEDLIHPNQQAIKYIYEKFKTAFFLENEIKNQDLILKVTQRLNHKPFNTQTDEYENFVAKTKTMISSNPSINWSLLDKFDDKSGFN